MNLFYISLDYNNKNIGVKKKIKEQLEFFKKNKIPYKILTTNNNNLKELNKLKKSFEKNNGNIYYIRNMGIFSIFFYKKLRKIKNSNILVLEIPTPINNLKKEVISKKDKLIKKILKSILISLNYPRIFKCFDIIIEFAPEDEKYIKGNEDKFIYINNGIDTNAIKIKEDKKEDKNLNILSVANNSKWHGYDRVIKGLHNYYENKPEKEVYYHCVGEGSELDNLKKMTKKLNMGKYVIFHGTKVGEELDKIVDESDVAFGSLGMHRIDLQHASTLKLREYCARGIPFVIAYDDWDFPKSFPYVFRIPSDDSPVDIHKVINWYEDLSKKHPDYSLEMRKYAEENLSWDAKLKPVIEKIKELARERNINI